MVIPWLGFPLADLLQAPRADLAGEVRRVHDAARPGADAGAAAAACSTGRTSRGCASTRRCTRSTLLAVGLYGKALPNQNGAPLRLVVPWKYGFKGIKSIVKIALHRAAAADDLEPRGAERVRLLREREPRGRPPALEPGDRAAHRRVPDAARRCRSTATPTRSRSLYAGMDLREVVLTAASRRPRLATAAVALGVRAAARRGSLVRARCAGALGANPIAKVLNQLGLLALVLLLAVARRRTPLRDPDGLERGRSAGAGCSGLFAFVYALLHFTTYAVLDQALDLPAIVEDIVKRPFIAVGFAALVLLVPLALTSTNARGAAARASRAGSGCTGWSTSSRVLRRRPLRLAREGGPARAAPVRARRWRCCWASASWTR